MTETGAPDVEALVSGNPAASLGENEMIKLFEDNADYPKVRAQRNLCGRTHYVDDDTLRFYHSRVPSAHVSHGGLIFSIVESVGLDWENTKRGYRPVVFDLFGNVISRVELKECFSTRKQAERVMWGIVNGLEPEGLTLQALERKEEYERKEGNDLRQLITKRTSEKMVAA